MLLTISTIYSPATDLGYLLHKHPARIQSFPLPFGQAHVFYPEARPEKCTAALLLDVDSVGLVRRPHGQFAENFALAQYVSDRPYVASSFLSVALSRVFGSALSGKCKERPELVKTAIPLSAMGLHSAVSRPESNCCDGFSSHSVIQSRQNDTP